jgi:hypothetical protein
MTQKPIFVPSLRSLLHSSFSILSFPSYIALAAATFLKPGLPDSFSLSPSLPLSPLPVTHALILLQVAATHPSPFVLAAPDAARPAREMLSNTFTLIGPPTFKVELSSMPMWVAWQRLPFPEARF